MFVLLLLMKTDSENKRKTWNQNTRDQHFTGGTWGSPNWFLCCGLDGLRGSGPALTCNVLRLEAAFVGMNHQVQTPWTEGRQWVVGGRPLERTLRSGGSLAYSRDSEGGSPGRDRNNKPELRCGRGLNKKQSIEQLLCAGLQSPVPLCEWPTWLLQGPCSPHLVTRSLKFTGSFFQGDGGTPLFSKELKKLFQNSPNC